MGTERTRHGPDLTGGCRLDGGGTKTHDSHGPRVLWELENDGSEHFLEGQHQDAF